MQWWLVAVSPALIEAVARAVALIDVLRLPDEAWRRARMSRGLWVVALLIVVGAGAAYWLVDRSKLMRPIASQAGP